MKSSENDEFVYEESTVLLQYINNGQHDSHI